MYPAAITQLAGLALRRRSSTALQTQRRGGRSPRAPPDQAALKWITFTSATARESGSTFNQR